MRHSVKQIDTLAQALDGDPHRLARPRPVERALKVRIDGIMMDGHHRIFILRERQIDVDALAREAWIPEVDT